MKCLKTWPRGYIKSFMLNIAEYEIYPTQLLAFQFSRINDWLHSDLNLNIQVICAILIFRFLFHAQLS